MQQKILDMIQENPKITQTAMAEKLDITPREVKKNIKEVGWQWIGRTCGIGQNGLLESKRIEKVVGIISTEKFLDF